MGEIRGVGRGKPSLKRNEKPEVNSLFGNAGQPVFLKNLNLFY
jgi:hypothetical protein